jgi:hypothetical protein
MKIELWKIKDKVPATIIGDGQRYAQPDGCDNVWLAQEKTLGVGRVYPGDKVWVLPPTPTNHYCEILAHRR